VAGSCYRVVRTRADRDDLYAIRRVRPDADGGVTEWASVPSAPQGTTVDNLRADLELMLAALNQPVLTEVIELRDDQQTRHPALTPEHAPATETPAAAEVPVGSERRAWSVEEAADQLGMTPWKVRAACRNRHLRSFKLGTRWIIPAEAIAEFLAREGGHASTAS
jgi:excisionase family DNA binding protein